MNKHDMIEEIIGARPENLLLDALWQDALIITRIRTTLQKVSEPNLLPYHKHFVHQPMERQSHISHTPIFKGGIPTKEYLVRMHIG